jgi:hypothetical protein
LSLSIRCQRVIGSHRITARSKYQTAESRFGPICARIPIDTTYRITTDSPDSTSFGIGSKWRITAIGWQAQYICFDEGRFAVAVIADLTNEWNCFLELIHRTRDRRDHEASVVTDRVQLTRTEPTFGGHRWWFLCPRTGRRTTKLFLPHGGWHFWSRQAYGLGYACQREDRFSRLQRRAATLNRQLGGEGRSTWADPPAKPKWMHWGTYTDLS